MRQRTLRAGIFVVAACALAAAGCNREEPRGPFNDNATIGQDDSRLATYVRARYQTDSSIRANDIHVSASNGVVTLRGTVPDDKVRQHAVQVAQQMDGVREVDNQLEVRSAGAATDATAAGRQVESGGAVARTTADDRSPGWITTKIQAQYFTNRQVSPWNIEVDTTPEGIVTLRGDVDSAAHRDEAARIARETEGVTRVENQLRVNTGAERSDADRTERDDRTAADGTADTDPDQPDAWVTAKVQAKYFMDSDVKLREIEVNTRDGVVTLTGAVESEGERPQAIALARNTEGVRSVTDQLQVQRADADQTRTDTTGRDTASARDGAGTTANDLWITTKVQSKFFLDTDIKGRDINVDARNGVVVLKGTVESEAEKNAAQILARDTEGVTRVDNRLDVGTTPKR